MGRNNNGLRAGYSVKSMSSESRALEQYVSGDFMYVNNALRGRNGMSVDDLYEDEKQMLNVLTKATNNKLGEEATLYRSVDASSIFGKMSDLQYSQLHDALVYNDSWSKNKISSLIQNAKGKVIVDKGFMSTTRDRNVADSWGDFTGSNKPIVLRMKTKKRQEGRIYQNMM